MRVAFSARIKKRLPGTADMPTAEGRLHVSSAPLDGKMGSVVKYTYDSAAKCTRHCADGARGEKEWHRQKVAIVLQWAV